MIIRPSITLHHHHRRIGQTLSGVNARWDDLFAGWHLDEASDGSAPVTRTDVLGTYDLTDNNTTASTAGQINNAAGFVPANNESLSYASAGSLADWTVSAWVYRPTGVTAGTIMFRHNAWPNSTNAALYVISSNLTALVGNGSAFVSANIAVPLPADGWHFVVAWYDSSTKKVNGTIDNGSVVSSAALSGSLYVVDTPIRIGTVTGVVNSAGVYVDEDNLFSTSIGSNASWRTGMYNGGAGVAYPN